MGPGNGGTNTSPLLGRGEILSPVNQRKVEVGEEATLTGEQEGSMEMREVRCG